MHIVLKKNDGKRDVVIPGYIKEALVKNNLLNQFLSQADYTKREQINFIELAKKEETKNNRVNALVEKIKGIKT